MNCSEAQPELVAWHFGELHGEVRDAAEAHIGACGGCMREFMELKRAVELAEGGEVPSTGARSKLRAAVVAAVDVAPSRAAWPVALAVASASLVFAVMLVSP